MDKDKALRMALEALEEPREHIAKHRRLEAIAAIKEALAQPEQESDDLTIAYMSGFHDGKNKDAPQRQPEQEPVAWELRAGKTDRVLIEITNNPQRAHDWKASLEEVVPLYTAPPQRTWVGLTEEEKESFWRADQMTHKEWDELFADVEAKLREKNGG